MPYSETHLFSDREEFKPEIIAGKGVGEQRLTLHRKNCRLYYMYLPTETREMVYVENFFETHWLEKARFGRRNVPWPSVEFVRSGSLLVESPDLQHPQHVPAGSLLWIPPVRETLLRPGPEGFCCKVSLTLGGILLPDWQAKSGFDQYRVLPQIDRKRFELLVEDFRRLSEQQSEEALHRNGLTTWKLLQFLQNPFPLREVPELELTSFPFESGLRRKFIIAIHVFLEPENRMIASYEISVIEPFPFCCAAMQKTSTASE